MKDLLLLILNPGICKDIMRIIASDPLTGNNLQAAAEKRMAKATLALEERHRNFHSLIEKAQNAASHPLNNGAVVNGSAYDYKDNGSPTTDGPKSNSLPSVSEDSDIPDAGTLLTSRRSLSQGRLDAQSWKPSPASVNDRVQGYTELTEVASKTRPTGSDSYIMLFAC